MQQTDETLVAAFRDGDDQALRTLVERHMAGVYRFVFGYAKDADTAEGITQDVFVKVWKNAKRFDVNKNFKTWLFTIAKNTALDSLKQKRSIAFSSFEAADGNNVMIDTIADSNHLPDELAAQSEAQKKLEATIDELNPAAGKLVKMRDFEQLSFKDIAAALGKPVNTVKSTYRRTLALLRKKISRSAPK